MICLLGRFFVFLYSVWRIGSRAFLPNWFKFLHVIAKRTLVRMKQSNILNMDRTSDIWDCFVSRCRSILAMTLWGTGSKQFFLCAFEFRWTYRLRTYHFLCPMHHGLYHRRVNVRENIWWVCVQRFIADSLSNNEGRKKLFGAGGALELWAACRRRDYRFKKTQF